MYPNFSSCVIDAMTPAELDAYMAGIPHQFSNEVIDMMTSAEIDAYCKSMQDAGKMERR